jgi:xylulokinase
MLPFLSGRRMPVADPLARAAFTGLTLSHDAGHMTRAVIEGACYAMAEGLECVRDLGIEGSDAVVTGGAARHQIWRDALALAMPGVSLFTAAPDDGAALGAALLGAAATGAPIEGAARSAVSHLRVEPGAGLGEDDYEAIAAGFRRYRKLAANKTITASEETQ